MNLLLFAIIVRNLNVNHSSADISKPNQFLSLPKRAIAYLISKGLKKFYRL